MFSSFFNNLTTTLKVGYEVAVQKLDEHQQQKRKEKEEEEKREKEITQSMKPQRKRKNTGMEEGGKKVIRYSNSPPVKNIYDENKMNEWEEKNGHDDLDSNINEEDVDDIDCEKEERIEENNETSPSSPPQPTVIGWDIEDTVVDPIDEQMRNVEVPEAIEPDDLCRKCSKKASSTVTRDIVAHMAIHDAKLLRFQCSMCPFKSCGEHRMNTHFNKIHKKDRRATIVDMMNDSMRSLLLTTTSICFPHYSQVVKEWSELEGFDKTNEDQSTTKTGQIQCEAVTSKGEKCTARMCLSQRILLKHCTTHITERTFKCSHCPKLSYASANSATNHVKKFHSNDESARVLRNSSPTFAKQLRIAIESCFPKLAPQLLIHWQLIYDGVTDEREENKRDGKEKEKENNEEVDMGQKTSSTNIEVNEENGVESEILIID